MDLEGARFLVSPEGRTGLQSARATRGLPPHRRIEALRGANAPEHVRILLSQDDLRRRANEKIPDGSNLLFTSGALQQASAWAVASERAGRWPSPSAVLHDLGAGIGLDALAAAAAGRRVVAYERDPARVVLLRHNIASMELSDRIEVIEGDVLDARPSGELAFLDPDRRPDGKRTRDAAAFEPPLQRWRALLDGFTASIVKVGPVVRELAETVEAPFEVVALRGRAREGRLYVGAWPDVAPRRATRLPDGAFVEGAGARWPDPVSVRPGAWLGDPDPSVTLAGLVGDLARAHGLAPVHPRIAYLTGTRPEAPIPVTWMRVDEVMRARAKEMNAWLTVNAIGRLTIRTRGVDDPVEAWRKRLRPKGPNAGTLVITRERTDRYVAYGCVEEDRT